MSTFAPLLVLFLVRKRSVRHVAFIAHTRPNYNTLNYVLEKYWACLLYTHTEVMKYWPVLESRLSLVHILLIVHLLQVTDVLLPFSNI